MAKSDRTALQEMYSRYAGERTDGGKDFTLDDHLKQAANFIRLGMTTSKLAEALSVPVEYTEALFAYAEARE